MNWNTCLPIILVFSMSGISCSLAVQSEQQQLDGVWTVVFWEVNGNESPTSDIGSVKLVVKDGKLTLERDGEPVSVATMKLDSTKSPKSLDIQVVSGASSGDKSLAIYKLDDDLLTVCWTLFAVDRDRPTEFATEPESGLMLVKYRRQKENQKDSETAGEQ